MAITGSKFMEVSKARTLQISRHAMDRIARHTGLEPTEALARTLFHRSRQVKAGQMWLMGYRPGCVRRKGDGRQSWYFRFVLFGEELIAVLQEGARAGEYQWVTTYGATPQSDLLRCGDYDLLAEAC